MARDRLVLDVTSEVEITIGDPANHTGATGCGERWRFADQDAGQDADDCGRCEFFDECGGAFDEGDGCLWDGDPDDFGVPGTFRNREVGARGEQAAYRYLRRMGYEILERNWKCPAGEADIVARDGEAIVFIEVKTRTSIARGFPEEAVDARKRARYERIAMWYLRGHDEVDVAVRFDIIAIMVVNSARAMLRHYVNAFGQGF